MKKLSLIASLIIGAAAVPAFASPTVQPSPDSARERQELQRLTACIAESRPRWARHTLSLPYLSEAQANAASLALSGKDSCVPRTGSEITFRTSSMVGSLADHYLRSAMGGVDLARVKAVLAAMAPLNVTEDFALCIASRHPAAARDLVLSVPGSAAESQAIAVFESAIEPCTAPGEDLTVDVQALRSLISTALYRGVTAVRTASN